MYCKKLLIYIHRVQNTREIHVLKMNCTIVLIQASNVSVYIVVESQ